MALDKKTSSPSTAPDPHEGPGKGKAFFDRARSVAATGNFDYAIDMYIEVPDNFGGFIRYYEAAQLIRVAAPLYLKFGLRNAPDIYPCGRQIEDLAVNMGRERIHRAKCALEILEDQAPEIKMSPLGSKDLGIPEV